MVTARENLASASDMSLNATLRVSNKRHTSGEKQTLLVSERFCQHHIMCFIEYYAHFRHKRHILISSGYNVPIFFNTRTVICK